MNNSSSKNKLSLKLSGIVSGIITGMVLLVISLPLFSKEYRVNSTSSTLEWNAKKVTGQHNGTISFGEGIINFDRQKITSGKVAVDMKTIANTDPISDDYKQKLIGHLKSDDFFGVEKFPVATLEVKNVVSKSDNLYHFTADLTIKGITSPVEFDADVNHDSDQITATGTMVVNRTKYGIKYGSGSFFEGLGDKMIYDEFTVKFKLVASTN